MLVLASVLIHYLVLEPPAPSIFTVIPKCHVALLDFIELGAVDTMFCVISGGFSSTARVYLNIAALQGNSILSKCL